MPRVSTNIPYTTSPINGVVFVEDRGEWISEEVSEEVAANFASIPGYSRLPEMAAPVEPLSSAPAPKTVLRTRPSAKAGADAA